MFPADDDRAITPQEFADKLQIKLATFYKHRAAGRFDRFELVPRIGPARYSRKLVAEYLDRQAPAALRLARTR